ncbi:MAG: cupin domain-containing protein [Proteobacteria bacterium]|nr:cupin domain-containing protein [Pseudomonadota bacterium]MBU1231696.1 cupin domain-containing protein [Pseudomonadota bacterium]MBU1420539.1 cupin domain-containing protein [Pseudomonadota bacterium]MBU1456102.1 cupin domain-containing protein [Pseudomonadota bacterium]
MFPLVTSVSEVEATPIGAAKDSSMQVLIPPSAAENFIMRRIVIKAGGYMPNHTNSVEHEQYVLAGSAEVGIGDEVYHLKQDDVLMIPAGVPHWYRASVEEDYVFICLIPKKEDIIALVDKA